MLHNAINLQGLGDEFRSTDHWISLTSKYVFISTGLHIRYVFYIYFCLFTVLFQFKWNVIIFKPVWSLGVVSSKLASLRTCVVLAMCGEFLLLMRKKKRQSCHCYPVHGHMKGNSLKHSCLISLRNVKGKKSTAVRRPVHWTRSSVGSVGGPPTHEWNQTTKATKHSFKTQF